MTKFCRQYIQYTEKLQKIHNDPEQEDIVLDILDAMWYHLTPKDKSDLNNSERYLKLKKPTNENR